MNKKLKIVIYGFLIWLIPFMVSYIIYPLKESARPLFESIMPLILSIVVIILAYYYIKDISSHFIKEGIVVGVIWYVINVAIDLCLFLPPSPMHMGLGDYMMDIGLTYLIIPVITIGMAHMASSGDD